MSIRRVGHRYREVASGKTIDVWFPQPNRKVTFRSTGRPSAARELKRWVAGSCYHVPNS